MKKKSLILLLLFVSAFTQAQYHLKAKVIPQDKFPWSILYELKDVKQMYVDNKQQNKDSLFDFDMSLNKPGMYLLMYDMDSHNFVYFIYNNEDVELKVYPTENNRIEVVKSKENKIFIPYVNKASELLGELKKLEKDLSRNKLSDDKKIRFTHLKKQLQQLQTESEKKSKKLLAHKYIRNSAEYFPDINLNKEAYFADKKAHYFDHLDFNDKDLQRSNIIIHKINSYVFDINPPVNPENKHLEYLKRIEDILPKIKDSLYRNNVIFSLTTSFVYVDGRVSKILIEKYIDKMPDSEKKKIDLKGILDEIGLTIGEKAPDFKFVDLQDKVHSLYKITAKKPYTLLIFWSATCPHCLKAMPKIQKMIKNRPDFNVVAIGLETEKYPWSSEHQYYPEFIHGLKLQKWENPIVKTYHIKATPTFFILNDKNEIIAEPYEVENIKKFLATHPIKK